MGGNNTKMEYGTPLEDNTGRHFENMSCVNNSLDVVFFFAQCIFFIMPCFCALAIIYEFISVLRFYTVITYSVIFKKYVC